MKNRKRSKPINRETLTVDPDDYAAIDKMAGSSDVSASWFIRRSMRDLLKRHQGETQLENPLDQDTC